MQTNAIQAQQLENHLTDGIRVRLGNWGRWWRSENVAELKRITGQINRSIFHTIAQQGKTGRTGYGESYLSPDDNDAEKLHGLIQTLIETQRVEIYRFYAYQLGSGTPAQKNVRYRAVNKLAGLNH